MWKKNSERVRKGKERGKSVWSVSEFVPNGARVDFGEPLQAPLGRVLDDHQLSVLYSTCGTRRRCTLSATLALHLPASREFTHMQNVLHKYNSKS